MADVTKILARIEQGDAGATEELLPAVYEELRRLAERKIRRESPGHTLQPTALVHEAYLRLAKEERESPWRCRAQFFAAAAEAMRRILVDQARRKKNLRRGGGLNRADLELSLLESPRPSDEILQLHEALELLAKQDPLKAELVKLRYFVGLTVPEAGEVLNISPRSVDRQWAYARAWLHRQIKAEPEE